MYKIIVQKGHELVLYAHLFDIWLKNLVQQANHFGTKYQEHKRIRNSYFETEKKDRKSTTLVIAKKTKIAL